MKISDCILLMKHRSLARAFGSIAVGGLLPGNEERLRLQLIDNVDALASTGRIAAALRELTILPGDRVLVETMLTALLLTPDLVLEEDHLFELVRGFEQSVLDEAAETGASGYAGEYLHMSEGGEADPQPARSTEQQSLRPMALKAGISRHSERLREAMHQRFPKPDNELHTLAEFLRACCGLQKAGVLFLCHVSNNRAAVILPEEIATGVKTVLGFELRPERQRLLQDVFSAEQLARALQSLGLSSSGSKSELSDRLIKSEVRPSQVLSVLTKGELEGICEGLPGVLNGGFKQDRIRAIIQYFEGLVIEEHGVRGYGQMVAGSADAGSVGCCT